MIMHRVVALTRNLNPWVNASTTSELAFGYLAAAWMDDGVLGYSDQQSRVQRDDGLTVAVRKPHKL